MDARPNADSYSCPKGRLKAGLTASVPRLPDLAQCACRIQQTRRESRRLPIRFDAKTSPLPRDLKEWGLMMADCRVTDRHVIGGRAGDQRPMYLRFGARGSFWGCSGFSADLCKTLIEAEEGEVAPPWRSAGTSRPGSKSAGKPPAKSRIKASSAKSTAANSTLKRSFL